MALPTHSTRRTTVAFPLAAAILLLAVLWFVDWLGPVQHRQFPDVDDLRFVIFGPELDYLKLAAALFIVVVLVRLISLLLFEGAFTRHKISAPLLLRQIVTIALYIILFSVLINTFIGGSAMGLLASGTIVAAVLGLALQDTLGNLFSGIALHMERAFDVGDVVQSDIHVGVVEGMNWRAARLRTTDNHIIVLPNSVIARERLEVFRRGRAIGRRVKIRGAYSVPPGELISVVERAVVNVPGISHEFRPFVRVSDFGESAVEYEIRYWLEDYHQRDNMDAEVRRVVWYALRRNGFPFPFPVRTLRRPEPEKTRGAAAAHEETWHRIEAVDLLDVLSEEQKHRLADATDRITFSRGETIIRQGEKGSSMFIVHQGKVSVRLEHDGSADELAQLDEGSMFGEMALLTGEPRSADVVALTDVVLLRIQKSAMQPLLDEAPGLAAALGRRMVERRSGIESMAHHETSEEVTTLMSRIRAWFAVL